MLNKRLLAVFKKEIKDKLLSKTFILMTILIPVFMFGILGIQTFLMGYEGDDDVNITFITSNENLNSNLKSEFDKLSKEEPKYKFKYFSDGNSFNIEKYKKDIIEEKLEAVIYLPDSTISKKEVEYYSKSPTNIKLFQKFENRLNNVLIANYFKDTNLNDQQLTYLKKNVEINGIRVSEDKVEKEGYGNQILSFLFTFLLYMSLLIIGSQMMRSVVEEKSNRIVEILLSSVNSTELITGKILGTALTGLVQMAIWLTPVFILMSTTVFILPADLILRISGWQLLYFLLNYVLGLVTYTGLFAAVGSMFDNEQDAQSGVWPIMMLIMIPFFIALGMQTNPNNNIATIASMFPFASIIVMPARIAIVDVPMIQLLLSIAINIITLLLIFKLSGKIYRRGLLRTGKKPSLKELISWVKS